MPLDKYYKGSGSKVMRSMKKQYGAKKGKSVFYATAKKQAMEPEIKSSAAKRKKTISKY